MKVTLWEDKNQKKVDPKLFSETAEKGAREFAEDKKKDKRKPNKRTQIRKFYDEVLRLDAEAKTRPEDWDFILPQIHMLTAKAAYAQGRGLVSPGFLEFIRSGVDQINEERDLRVFAMFFEAVMGFYRMLEPSN